MLGNSRILSISLISRTPPLAMVAIPLALAKLYANAGVSAIITTDISKDGTLSGVNVELSDEIARASGIATIASGGVRDISDIERILEFPSIAGVIVGKAYYEGTLDLKTAFKMTK